MSNTEPSRAVADEDCPQQKIGAAMIDESEESGIAEMSNEETSFEDRLKKLVGDEIAATEAITSRDGLSYLKEGVKAIGLILKRGEKLMTDLENKEDRARLDKFMWGVGHLEKVTPDFNKEGFHLQGTLTMITRPKINFPVEYQQVAQYLLDKFEKQAWGVVQKVNKEAAAATSKAKKRSTDTGDEEESTPKAKKVKAGPLDKSKLRRPQPNHAIYGEDGIMRGILRYQTGATSAMCLDDKFEAKDARNFGDNGLEVGAWFPRLIAALRDGCHGERMAGVAGDTEKGAWSVVVSDGGYAEIDKDLGNTIVYSAPGAFETKAKTAENDKRGAKCLLRSYETKRPIRVLRGKTNWQNAPSVGYRYDGLYQVEEKGEGKNGDGGIYIWVKLVRLADQEPIKTKIPKGDQRRQEEKVSEGY